MGIHERTEEVLAIANHTRASPARYADSVDARLSGRALCVYLVLGEGYGVMNLRTVQRDFETCGLYL